MTRVRKLAARIVSGCGMALVVMLGAPAVLLLAAANGIRKAFDWFAKQIEE